MITLTLLNPGQTVPVQNWTFDTKSIIRIGRSTDNDVVLYSAVVSRHHLEIKQSGSDWELVNFGANGTYLNGQLIAKTLVLDGMIIRLASSGPKIQIRIPPEDPQTKLPDALHEPTLTEDKDYSKKTIIN